jgi:tetratricopeptide (TPR) repeat protein
LQAPLLVKGKAEPVQTYIVHRAKPRAFRIPMRGVEGVETRMIGRTAEMFQLQKMFEACISQRNVQTVNIVGEAGLGKSRLMQEFFDWVETSPVLCRLFRGRSTPSVIDSPYALLRDLFAFRFEIQEDKSLAAARETLEQGITSLLPDDPQAQEKAHFIGHLLGWDFSASPYIRGLLSDAAQIRTLAMHFLTLFIGKITQERPLVILLDDLHWADRGSLDVLRYMLENLPTNIPLMLIANTRPPLFERYPAWNLAVKTSIYLRPLTDTDSAALVSDILRYLPTLPPTLQDLIVRQAEGNPFYVEELIKMLIDEKVIQPGANEWHVTVERLKNLRVPPTLVGILQARLDSLPPTERLVLQQAAVMGRTFWDTAIQSLDSTSPPLDTLHVTLDAIQSRELLFRSMTSSFSDAREYRFKHALLRDVTYETVLKRDRPAYHARAAAWLESVCGARRNEYLPLLAEHSEKAGNLEAAATLWNEAGERAFQLSAFAEAADFYKRAVELVPQASDLLCKLGKAYYHLGELQLAHEILLKAREVAANVSDLVRAQAEMSAMESRLGDYNKAQELLVETVPLARKSGDPALLSRALFELGDVNWKLGKLDEARALIEECLELSRSIGDVHQELYALNRLGVVLGHFDLDAGDRFIQEAYVRATELGNRNLALMAINNLGEAAKVRQDYTAAREYHLKAFAQAQAISAKWYIAMVIFNLAEDDIFLGQFPSAKSRLREGLKLTTRMKMSSFAIPAMIYFGHLAYAEGQVERALDLWGLAQKHPAWSSDNQYELNMALERSTLDPAIIQQGLEHGATLNLDQTIKELLDE